MHAEPQPASLPLPGGRDGATVRLRPLMTGTVTGPAAWFHREDGRLAGLHALGIGVGADGMVEEPAPAFLVEHPTAGRILVDTGYHPSVAVDPKQNLGRLNARAFKPKLTAADAVPAQLRARGIDQSEVGTVLMTHLHSDHASAMSEFPGATFLFALEEWESATTIPRPAFHGYVRRQFDHAFEYRTVDFEQGAYVDSFATFGRAVDVFGDGSVRLVYTPGHTFGHMSVVVRLNGREALIAGDAIYSKRTLETGHKPYRMEDEHLFERSLREIQLYVEQTPDALVIPGHDMETWRKLDAVYE
ncbi:MAG: N-acyl homoserine lactone hydrolase [Thermoleophilales bacterium]|nr:N-acyl homoserine lactone hydrolase [Thermoleophilales bacterium]